MQGREVRAALAERVEALEHRPRRRPGARERPLGHGRVGQQPLEQLADDAEREVALEVRAAGREHARAGALRAAAHLAEQPRLADAGRALDQRRAALARQRVAEQRAERRQLALALHQAAHRGRRRRGGRRSGLLAQQPLVQRDQRRARRGPELLAQQHPHVLEHAQGLGDVAARVQHLHQRGARGLAERRRLDRRPRRALGLVLLRPAHRRAGRGADLQRLQAQVAQLRPAHVDPARLQPRQQSALGDRQRLPGGRERRRRVPRRQGRPRRGHARARDLPVHPGVVAELQPQLAAPDEPARRPARCAAATAAGRAAPRRSRTTAPRPARHGGRAGGG